MVIAFCTSCMDRKWQLENTLPHNLELIRRKGHLLALCNYNSRDGLDEWVRAHHETDTREGALLYFHTREPATFHMSVAKNLSHRLALRRRPDVLFNLDGDNFVTEATVDSLQRAFSGGGGRVLHNWTWDWNDGSAGRVAISAGDWSRLGGYDESLLPMTVQDVDLLFRARAAGLSYVLDRTVERPALANDVMQKLQNVPAEKAGVNIADRFRLMMAENFSRALARPLVLPVAEQRRFRGLINFREEAEV
jgi:hypothetical protein